MKDGAKGASIMPNISLTFRCNLRCPYCFAHEFVDPRAADIALDDFDRAVEFCTRQAPVHIGLIGGEPTLHPQFNDILKRLIDNPRILAVTVFTNGILLDKSFDLLEHPKVSLLVNWNAAEEIGQTAFDRIRANVDELILKRGMARRVNLGLNLHGEDMDYRYMLELLKRYGLKKVRMSLTVPDFPAGCGTDVLAYFRSRKPFLMRLFKDMDEIGVLPYYDCNRPPQCIWTEEERRWLEDCATRHGAPAGALADAGSFCRPVIDITPDLQAVRCFGMSYFDKVPIADFASLSELQAYFMREIDRPAFRIFAAPECENCYLRRQWLCCQGCMGFKGDKIREDNRMHCAQEGNA